eukprot:5733753-Pleurochrysis_carterae.AAC.2
MGAGQHLGAFILSRVRLRLSINLTKLCLSMHKWQDLVRAAMYYFKRSTQCEPHASVACFHHPQQTPTMLPCVDVRVTLLRCASHRRRRHTVRGRYWQRQQSGRNLLPQPAQIRKRTKARND